MTLFGRHDHIWKTCPYMEFGMIFGVWPYLGNMSLYGIRTKFGGITLLEIYDAIFT